MVRRPVIKRPLAQIEEDIALGAIRMDDAIAELADAARIEEVAALVAGRAGLARAHVLTVLRARAERPAALLCRAAGLSVNGYSAILRMRHRRSGTVGAGPAELLQAYLGLERLRAGELVDFWQEAGLDLEGA